MRNLSWPPLGRGGRGGRGGRAGRMGRGVEPIRNQAALSENQAARDFRWTRPPDCRTTIAECPIAIGP